MKVEYNSATDLMIYLRPETEKDEEILNRYSEYGIRIAVTGSVLGLTIQPTNDDILKTIGDKTKEIIKLKELLEK